MIGNILDLIGFIMNDVRKHVSKILLRKYWVAILIR